MKQIHVRITPSLLTRSHINTHTAPYTYPRRSRVALGHAQTDHAHAAKAAAAEEALASAAPPPPPNTPLVLTPAFQMLSPAFQQRPGVCKWVGASTCL
jgi:hypothetical protein